MASQRVRQCATSDSCTEIASALEICLGALVVPVLSVGEVYELAAGGEIIFT